MKTEGKIQQEIYMWFKNNFCLKHHNPRFVIFSVPNESENQTEIRRKMAIGLLKGASDLIVVRNKELLFVETKTPEGSQSPEQIDFQKTVEALGFRYELVRSLEQFQKIL